MWTSSATRSGSSACTFRMASIPSVAVPTTVNSLLASSTSAMTWRTSALSSTTSTERGLEDTIPPLQRAHAHDTGDDIQEDTAAVLSADVFCDDRELRRRERAARRVNVSLTH